MILVEFIFNIVGLCSFVLVYAILTEREPTHGNAYCRNYVYC